MPPLVTTTRLDSVAASLVRDSSSAQPRPLVDPEVEPHCARARSWYFGLGLAPLAELAADGPRPSRWPGCPGRAGEAERWAAKALTTTVLTLDLW